MTEWYSTVMGTRVFADVAQQPVKQLGHVRNKGPKKWHCEYYATGETHELNSLLISKQWVEQRHNQFSNKGAK